ncbi:MAG: NUDIX hydrolase, partial [Lysobacteraceae bacterium]
MDHRQDDPAPTAVTAWEGRWLRIRTRGTWEYAERTHAEGKAVIIVAVTPEQKLLFVEQYRVPLQQRTIEMPAGLVGDQDGEDTLEMAAARELLEETGWQAAHVEVLMEGPTSSG